MDDEKMPPTRLRAAVLACAVLAVTSTGLSVSISAASGWSRGSDLRGVVPARGRRIGRRAGHDRPRRLRFARGNTEGERMVARRRAPPAPRVASYRRGLRGSCRRCRRSSCGGGPARCGGRRTVCEMDSLRRTCGGSWRRGHRGASVDGCDGASSCTNDSEHHCDPNRGSRS